jgi:hypothetical protein
VGFEGIFLYILKVFYFKLFFLFLNCFNVLILKNKKYYFNIFLNKIIFKKTTESIGHYNFGPRKLNFIEQNFCINKTKTPFQLLNPQN